MEKLQAKIDTYAKQETPKSVSELLYRGHPDSRWKLETTLERSIQNKIILSEYHDLVYDVVKPKIESVTGKKDWCIPSQEEFGKWLDKQHSLPFEGFPGYDFLAYLRHHGLPSPLLDWTISPYVAAHFAIAPPPRKGVLHAAVYVYLEDPNAYKTGSLDAPAIQCLPHYVTTHRRHYLQQSKYTICTTGNCRSLQYSSHQDVANRNVKDQDMFWKLVIPISERRNFVEHLQQMNINPFSLFETEDSLMDDICLSEMFLRKRL